MDIFEMLIFFAASAAWFGLALFLTVILHETGHLIGGRIAGYSFAGFAVMGFLYDGRKVNRYKRTLLNAGQCFMYSGDFDRNPVPLILGGCVMNLFLGLLFTLLAVLFVDFGEFTLSDMFLFVFLAMPAVINIFMGVFNLFFGSDTSDGKTFSECRTEAHREEYNRIMAVTKHLLDGLSFCAMPDELFVYEKDWKTNSLSAEMRLYSYYRETELADSRPEYVRIASLYGFNGDTCLGGKFFKSENELERVIYEVLVNRKNVSFAISPYDPRTYLPDMFSGDGKTDPKGPDLSVIPFPGIAASFEKCCRNGLIILHKGGNKNG